MGEFLLAVAGGLAVSLINKYVISGTLWAWCQHKRENEDDDEVSSQTSAVSLDIHVHH